MAMARVTVTLPTEIVQDIDRIEGNRSRFILEAVRQEIKRRRRRELVRSLANPHPETAQFAEFGLNDWAQRLPDEDASTLLDLQAGTPVRWTPDQGWVESGE